MRKNAPARTLEKWLESHAGRQDAGALQPLPPTRELGRRFGISHGTVFRRLIALEKAGRVWRHPNGRFYPALARKVLGRPKPVAVLLRRMQAWSTLCREVMEGFTDECGEREQPILWFHSRRLVEQKTPDGPPHLESVRGQRAFLEEFALHYGDAIGGVLYDEVWRDEAIRNLFPAGLRQATFFRSSTLDGLAGIAADFKAGALLAISHLLAGGYENICLVDPLPGYVPGRLFIAQSREVYREIGGRAVSRLREAALHTPAQRRNFLRALAASRTKTGVICPEDNLSLSLYRDLRQAGLAPGKSCGLISLMGSSAIDGEEITCVRFDFREMGRQAAAVLCGETEREQLIAPRLDIRSTTAG